MLTGGVTIQLWHEKLSNKDEEPAREYNLFISLTRHVFQSNTYSIFAQPLPLKSVPPPRQMILAHLPMKRKMKLVGNACGNAIQQHQCITCHSVRMARCLRHLEKVTDLSKSGMRISIVSLQIHISLLFMNCIDVSHFQQDVLIDSFFLLPQYYSRTKVWMRLTSGQ